MRNRGTVRRIIGLVGSHHLADGPILDDEKNLEQAERTLESWAYALAATGRDTEAAEALRVSATILEFRTSFLLRDKRR